MAQKQIDIRKLEAGMTLSLGGNTSMHLFFTSANNKILIKLRREDASKGRVFTLSVDQWEKLELVRETVNEWIKTVQSCPNMSM